MKRKIIDLLCQKEDYFISGEEIAEQLNMTRANVWKYMKELRESGFEIESATKKGYILKSVGMQLNEDTIYYHFKKQNFVKNILFFPRIDSTNDFLKYNREEIPDCTLVVSTFQTKGRGRRTKEFLSEEGGLYFSFMMRNTMNMQEVSFITSLAAVAVNRALSSLGIDTEIKWPNDIFLNDKKLCGILTEMVTDMEGYNKIIVGIGINISNVFPEELKEIAISLLKAGHQINEITFLLNLFSQFEFLYNKFVQGDREEALKVLRDKSYLMNKEICFLKDTVEHKGTVVGLEENGNLVVRLSNKAEIALNSGEVTILKKKK
jgi:biotin--[acetyl-coA-carboxylase] ligase